MGGKSTENMTTFVEGSSDAQARRESEARLRRSAIRAQQRRGTSNGAREVERETVSKSSFRLVAKLIATCVGSLTFARVVELVEVQLTFLS